MITNVTTGDYGALEGQVFVDSYYDKESTTSFIPVEFGSPVGTDYLGSEYEPAGHESNRTPGDLSTGSPGGKQGQ